MTLEILALLLLLQTKLWRIAVVVCTSGPPYFSVDSFQLKPLFYEKISYFQIYMTLPNLLLQFAADLSATNTTLTCSRRLFISCSCSPRYALILSNIFPLFPTTLHTSPHVSLSPIYQGFSVCLPCNEGFIHVSCQKQRGQRSGCMMSY